MLEFMKFIVANIQQRLGCFTLAVVLGLSLVGAMLGGCPLALTRVKSTGGNTATLALGKDINYRERRNVDRFLSSQDAREISNKPSLINDLDWLAKHPQLQAFLKSHPRIRKDSKEHPEVALWSAGGVLSNVRARQGESNSEKIESANKDRRQQVAFLNFLALLMLAY